MIDLSSFKKKKNEEKMKVIIRDVRISDPENIARVNVDTWRIAYAGLIDENTLQNLSYSEKANRWRDTLESLDDRTVIYIAEVGDNLVGFVLAGQEQQDPSIKSSQYRGELRAIYVSERFQRRGIGTRLVLKVIDYLIKNDVNSMCVWTLKGNPYSDFYVKLGAKLIDSKPHFIDQKEYTLISYGWKDIKSLTNSN